MAKFVIAGKSECPYYAKAELLGDYLASNLPNFKIHKIVKDPNEWDSWLKNVCAQNQWKHTKSPIIWRELVDRGGKGMLLGDANEFQEYARDYYGISSEYPQLKKKSLISDDLKKISSENANVYKLVEEEKKQVFASIKPLNITITNPDTPVVYFIISEILSGAVFGQTDIFIRLYTEEKSDKIEGLRMEIEDLASSKLRNIKVVNNAEEAFMNCDYAILFDELKKTSDSSKAFHNPYVSLAKCIDQYANTTCKILITPLISHSEIYALVNVFSKHLKRINPKKKI